MELKVRIEQGCRNQSGEDGLIHDWEKDRRQFLGQTSTNVRQKCRIDIVSAENGSAEQSMNEESKDYKPALDTINGEFHSFDCKTVPWRSSMFLNSPEYERIRWLWNRIFLNSPEHSNKNQSWSTNPKPRKCGWVVAENVVTVGGAGRYLFALEVSLEVSCAWPFISLEVPATFWPFRLCNIRQYKRTFISNCRAETVKKSLGPPGKWRAEHTKKDLHWCFFVIWSTS